MGNIICLMGKSSSGKDTIFKLLMEDMELNLKPVVSYTTRPIRNNETDGVEYFFIDQKKLQIFKKQGKIIEKRKYNTDKGVWYYCTIDDGQIDLAKGNYILITTLEAYRNIQDYFKPENVVPVYIAIDDASRLERSLAREKQQQNPNYNELCRRFLVDNVDFSADNLEGSNIQKHYDNYNINECIANIKEDLLKLI